jgi:hypothetical protein
MNAQEKYESLDEALQSLDEFPLKLSITEEERKKLGLWISKSLALAYDKGFEDGRNSK